MAKANRKKTKKKNKESNLPKTAPDRAKEPIPRKWKLTIAGILAALAMLIYSPSYNYDFVYDDHAVVKDNRFVKQGLGGLDEIWTTTYFRGFDENINARAFRPIPLTTLALEYEIWGLNSTVNHIFNLLFYGLTGFFLFLFLAKLLRDHHPLFPIIATLLFLLHPIHLEVVANIKSRDTMLGFLNFIIASWLLLKHVDSRKTAPLIGALFFYFIALFSKEEVITTVAIIPAMLWCFRKEKFGRTALLALPFLVAAAIFLVVRSEVVGGFNGGVELTYLDNSLLAANGVAERSASNLLVIGHYLLKTVWPHPLISDYSFSTIPLTNWGDWRVYLSLFLNVGLFIAGLWGVIKKKPWGFALFWYFTAVSIFTSIITPNVSAYNDRFLYTPVLGICLLAAWGLSRLAGKFGTKDRLSFSPKTITLISIVAVLSAVSILKIESHLPLWKNRFGLFAHDAKLVPTNARTRKNHGGSLARKAVAAQKTDPEKMRMFAKAAIKELEAALAIYPNITTGYIHKGNMHILLGENQQAIATLSEVLRRAPNNYFAKSSLANVYFRQGDYARAVQILESIPPHLRRKSDLDLMERGRARM